MTCFVSELRVIPTPEGAAGAEYGRAGTETLKKAVRGFEEEPAIPLAHQ